MEEVRDFARKRSERMVRSAFTTRYKVRAARSTAIDLPAIASSATVSTRDRNTTAESKMLNGSFTNR